MRIHNPVGKHVNIVPCNGGLVVSGKLIALTENNAITVNNNGDETVTVLENKTMTLSNRQIISDVVNLLDWVPQEEHVIAIVDAYIRVIR